MIAARRCPRVGPLGTGLASGSACGTLAAISRSNSMNEDTIKGQWKQLKGKAKAAWGDLTDDELTQVEGNAEQLSGLRSDERRVGKERIHMMLRAHYG